jgi:cytochrome c2
LIRVEVRYDNEKLKAFLKQPAKKITDGGMPWVELAGADLRALISYLNLK